MKLVFFTHPAFVGSRSQDRYAHLLVEGSRERGHQADLRRPQPVLRRLLARGPLAKWAGYVDQYLLFPPLLRLAASRDPADTVYVFCDQALGPWVPALVHRPHVVHCHDLLALRSALGDLPEHRTSWTGRLYQRWIRAGFRRARHFISISRHTRSELARWGGIEPLTNEVVHNGLNHAYRPLDAATRGARLQAAGLQPGPGGYLLHVGGGQWYKHTEGVLALYAALLRRGSAPALWIVGPPLAAALQAQVAALPAGAQVRVMQDVPAALLEALYGSAHALLFPSLAEGFGWPIAEALACGCAVLTTGEAPMTEVGGPCAHYLPRRRPGQALAAWAEPGGDLLHRLVGRSDAERARDAEAGVQWAARFDAARAVDACLQVYGRVLELHRAGAPGLRRSEGARR